MPRWFRFAALLALLLPPARAAAQGDVGRISGTITAIEGAVPVAGARVAIIGTRLTAETNAQGRYTIAVAPGSYRLRAASIGFTPVIMDSVPVTAGKTTTADFSLKRQTVTLEQVIVTGYGSQAKRDVTGAVGSVTAEQIQQIPTTNALDAIKGRIPGVEITSSGYKPGDGVTVRVRGARSIKASNDPLYVLDGIPIAGGIGDLNPSDIESIEVLKDASATAIYGSRGSNGVVLVTTRRGTAGRTRITYDSYVSAQRAAKKVDVFDGPAFANYKREAYRAAGVYKCPVGVAQCAAGDADAFFAQELAALNAGISTDWQDIIVRSGSQTNNQLSIAGGTDRTQFAVSGNLLQQTGVIRSQDYDRKSMRVNFETQAAPKFRVGGSAQVVRSLQNIGRGDELYGEALTDVPTASPFDSTGAMIFKPTPDPLRANPLGDVANFVDQRLRTRTFGTLFAAAQLTDGIEYRVNFGPDLTFQRRGLFHGAQSNPNQGTGADASLYNDKTFDYTLDNLLNVKRDFGADHRLNATLLYSIERQSFENDSSKASGLPYESQLFYNLGSGSTVEAIGSQISEWALQSYMARLNYTFRDRYLLTLTTRVDGSSRLAPGNKYSTFPSVALGWRVIDGGTTVGPLNSLKLRSSYGITGNTSVNPYQTEGSLTRSVYSYGTASAFGFRPGQLPNADLKWEKTTQVDGGADFGLWHDRLTGTLDYYRATTNDLLLDRNLPPTTGYKQITQNIGSTRNTGVELALSALTVDGWRGLRWSNDFAFSVNKNEILSLQYGDKSDPGNVWFIGQPIDAGNGSTNRVYYDYRFLGIWQQADSALAAKYGQLPGQIRVQDIDDNGKIDANDKQILGNTYPKFTGSLNSRVDFRNIDLSVQAITRQGFMVRNTFRTDNSTLAGRYNGIAVNYWTPTNPSNSDPRPNKNQERPIYGDSRAYEDGSYVRVRNITVGVKAPEWLATRAGAQSLRIYGTASNPFTWTSSTVLDPEGRASAGTPSFKTYLLGASVGF